MIYQWLAEKGAALGYASLDAAGALVEAATKIREAGGPGGPTTLTVGAIADGEYARRVGTTLVGGTPAGGGGADLTAIEALTGTGVAARAGEDTWALRTITGTSGRLVVTNGSGAGGNPTLDIGADVALLADVTAAVDAHVASVGHLVKISGRLDARNDADTDYVEMRAAHPDGISGNGVVTVGYMEDSYAPVAHAHVPSDITLTAPGLVGRSAAGSGAAGLITLGTNLSFSGDVLNATSGASTITRARKTADQTVTATTMVAATDLSLELTSGVLYRVRVHAIFRTVATTTGIRLGLTFPAVTVMAGGYYIPSAADGVGGELQGWSTSSGDSVIGLGVQAANTDYLAQGEFLIRPSATGNVVVTFGSEVGGSGCTLRADSILEVESLT